MDFEEGEGEGAALIGSGGPISDVFALSTPLPAKRGVGFAGYDEPKEEPKQPSPKKKAVVIRTYSDSSHEASSKAGSSVASSHALGASLMAANGLGLTILQRDEWTTKVRTDGQRVGFSPKGLASKQGPANPPIL